MLDARAETLLNRYMKTSSKRTIPNQHGFYQFFVSDENAAGILEYCGFSVARLNGSMDMEERRGVERVVCRTDADSGFYRRGRRRVESGIRPTIDDDDPPWNPSAHRTVYRSRRSDGQHPGEGIQLDFRR